MLEDLLEGGSNDLRIDFTGLDRVENKGGLRRDIYGLRVFVMPFGKSDTRFP